MEYTFKTPMWAKDGTLYRQGTRNVSEAHAVELNLPGARTSAPAEPKVAESYPYADLLAANGFPSWGAVQAASDDQLLAINGIGQRRVDEIRSHKPA